MARVEFVTLRVAAVRPETDDAVSITFEVPPHRADGFRWIPGQHVTLRARIDGEDVRRSYSICSPTELRVGVKRIADGRFSSWAMGLRPGDVLEVAPPAGDFRHQPMPGAARRYVAIAAGSGITPVLAIVGAVLTGEPASSVTLVYGNRTSRSIMFLEELEALKNLHPERFQLVHVLSREPSELSLFAGRIDGAKLDRLLDTLIDPAGVDAWFVCGPWGLVETVREVLGRRGVAADAIHDELFFDTSFETPPEPPPDATGHAPVRITLDGRTSLVLVDPAGAPILDYARTVRAEVPFACKGGMCATCKAIVVDGEVRMDKNYALTDEELAAGLVLTCQAHPVGDAVHLSYDTHGGIGR